MDESVDGKFNPRYERTYKSTRSGRKYNESVRATSLMFKPSRISHASCGENCTQYISEVFGVLCWNVYKNNQKNPRFKQFLQSESTKRNIDLMLFQEAGFKDETLFDLPQYAYDAAANIEFRKQFYGVMTLSKVESYQAQAYLSEGRESLFGPHKSLLQSYYHFKDGSTLLILNVHAINFRENKRYSKELDYFRHLLKEHQGPMILAGDFNSWNKTRMHKLQQITEALSLKTVSFKKTGKVKSFMGKSLDFIFYRDLEVMEAEVLEDHRLSDHNPLFVEFKRKI